MLSQGVFWVFLGAAFGGLCRFTLAESFRVYTRLPGWMPIFVANALGSLLIGCLYSALKDTSNHLQTGDLPLNNEMLYALCITGFCGGLTTYSTFSLDNLLLIYEKKWFAFGFNLIGSVVICMLAVFLGLRLCSP